MSSSSVQFVAAAAAGMRKKSQSTSNQAAQATPERTSSTPSTSFINVGAGCIGAPLFDNDSGPIQHLVGIDGKANFVAGAASRSSPSGSHVASISCNIPTTHTMPALTSPCRHDFARHAVMSPYSPSHSNLDCSPDIRHLSTFNMHAGGLAAPHSMPSHTLLAIPGPPQPSTTSASLSQHSPTWTDLSPSGNLALLPPLYAALIPALSDAFDSLLAAHLPVILLQLPSSHVSCSSSTHAPTSLPISPQSISPSCPAAPLTTPHSVGIASLQSACVTPLNIAFLCVCARC